MTAPGPWFKTYWEDLFGVSARLTPLQFTCYHYLLGHQWIEGSLPDDEAILARLARVSVGVWRRRVAPAVLPFFRKLKGGGLANERLFWDRVDAVKQSVQRAEAGRRGAQERWQKRGAEPDLQAAAPTDDGREASGGAGEAMAEPWQDDSDAMAEPWQRNGKPMAEPWQTDGSHARALDSDSDVDKVPLPPVAAEPAGSAPGEGGVCHQPGSERCESQADGKAMGPPSAPVPLDARRALFSQGPVAVQQLTGRCESSARTLIGQLLKAASDDAATVQAAIAGALEVRPADPAAWLLGALRQRASRAKIAPDDLPYSGRGYSGNYIAAKRLERRLADAGLTIDGDAGEVRALAAGDS